MRDQGGAHMSDEEKDVREEVMVVAAVVVGAFITTGLLKPVIAYFDSILN